MAAKGLYKTVCECVIFLCAPVDGVEYFRGGKGVFFMFSEAVPVDKDKVTVEATTYHTTHHSPKT